MTAKTAPAPARRAGAEDRRTLTADGASAATAGARRASATGRGAGWDVHRQSPGPTRRGFRATPTRELATAQAKTGHPRAAVHRRLGRRVVGIPEAATPGAALPQRQAIGVEPDPYRTGSRCRQHLGAVVAPAPDHRFARVPEAVAAAGRDQRKACPGGGDEGAGRRFVAAMVRQRPSLQQPVVDRLAIARDTLGQRPGQRGRPALLQPRHRQPAAVRRSRPALGPDAQGAMVARDAGVGGRR